MPADTFQKWSTDSLIDLNFYLTGNDLDSSLVIADVLINRFDSQEDTIAGIYGYSAAGYTHYYLDNYDDGIRAFKNSIRIAGKSKKYASLVVEGHSGIAALYSLKGEYKKAIYHTLKAEHFISDDFRGYDRSVVYQGMAQVFFDIGEYESALKYARRCNRIFAEELDSSWGSSPTLILTADLLQRRGRLDSAEKIALSELETSRTLEQTMSEVYALEVLAAIYEKRDNLDSAISLQQHSYELASQFNDRFTLALETSALAEYLLKKGQLNAAQRLVEEALQITERFPPNHARKRSLWVAYLLANAQENTSAALSYLKDHAFIDEKMARAGISEELIRSKYEVSEKEKNLLELKSKLQDRQLESTERINWLMTASTILMAIVGLAIFMAFRNSRRYNRKLNHKQKILNDQRQELKALNQELELNGRNKDKLLSILSHDVRQPFNQTLGLLDILQHSPLPDDGMRDMVKNIKLSVYDHKSSIDNLLTWSKNQLDGIKRYPEALDISNLFADIEQSLSSSLKEKKLRISSQISADAIPFADGSQMEMVFRNLLGNAMKFSHPGSEIWVKAWRENDKVMIQVIDQGVGMDREQQKRLLDRRDQFSHQGTLNESGSGFGTLIILDFVDQNEGKLELSSEPGKGSTFTIILKAASQEAIEAKMAEKTSLA